MAINIPNAREYEGILTGGQPSAEQYAQAKEQGYTLVVTLRGAHEPGAADAKQVVEALGMTFVEIPICGGPDLCRENAQRLADVLATGQRAIVHCKAGSRVGALFALKAGWIDGADIDSAVAIGLKTGLGGMEAAIRQLLKG